MSATRFRKAALTLPEVVEGAHQGHADFRVGKRIFATLGYPDKAWGMVKLTPEQQSMLAEAEPDFHPGDVLAKIPRETTKTKDITGGLPRVVELFEARKPRETAVISEIDGTVKFGEVAKGQRKLYVVADNGTEKEYSVPRGVHINVQEGERMKAGEPCAGQSATA